MCPFVCVVVSDTEMQCGEWEGAEQQRFRERERGEGEGRERGRERGSSLPLSVASLRSPLTQLSWLCV